MFSNAAKGNVAMSLDKLFSGLNANALRYLMPTWMSAASGTVLRLGFGALAFWSISFFTRHQATPISWRMKLRLFLLGLVVMYGFMISYLLALSYTTPLTVTLVTCIEPVWVLLLAALFLHAKITKFKVLGIILGLGGALACLLGQKSSAIASNPTLGIAMAVADSILYSVYIIYTKKLLRSIDLITFNKWTFSGAAIAALATLPLWGWKAPVLLQGVFSTPFLLLLFVLFIPSVLDYYLNSVGLKFLSATTVAIYGYLKIVVVMVVGYIAGQDHFEWYQMGTIALIVASVYFVEIAGVKPSNHSPAPSNTPAAT